MKRRLVALLVVAAAVLPYLPTLDDYFVQDDFGVVWLLASKPAAYFPHWFVVPWMEDIWGEPPDEIRPFPAVTYQVAALFGAGSPAVNHVINIGFHAVNGLLVLRLAGAAAGLSLVPAAFAALVFVLLPMQSESVAWITGRVDSMPACFYIAAFLLYLSWRSTQRTSTYVWAVILCFVALFTKQNAVTLPAALVLYDLIVAGRPLRVSWSWIKPYVPFVALTAGYLALRYVLFGEVAREGRLGSEAVDLFIQNVSVHLRRMVLGEPGLRLAGAAVAAGVGAGAVAVIAIGALLGDRRRLTPLLKSAFYFLVVWVALGLAPTLVAGYGSPRHMYLASAGWAVALGIGLTLLMTARPRRLMAGLGLMCAATAVIVYGLRLRDEVRLWGVRSAVSHKIVVDLEREAMAAPAGTLMIIDAPFRSWNFAVPHALRPPFMASNIAERALVISHSSIYCCSANFWEEYTRRHMRTWMANPAHPPVFVLRWDQDTGELFRVSDADDPFVRSVVPLLLDAPDVTTLDRLLLNVTEGMAVRQ